MLLDHSSVVGDGGGGGGGSSCGGDSGCGGTGGECSGVVKVVVGTVVGVRVVVEVRA